MVDDDIVILEERSERKVDARIVKRATPTGAAAVGSPQAFDAYLWLLRTFEDLTGITLIADTDGITSDIKRWFENQNTEEADWPDVGFVYWVTYPFRCEFPENLNCARGIGWRAALGEVGKWFFLVIVVLMFAFPGGLALVGGLVTVVILYFVMVAIVGWHYSPWCMFLTPSFLIRPGISLPLLPIPMSLWALPECLYDDVFALVDDWLSSCPSFLADIAYLFNGDFCPTCPERASFVSCKAVGIYDGLSNVLFFIYHYAGEDAYKLVMGVVQAPFFYWIPGAARYMQTMLELFQETSQTQLDRQLACAWITILSVAWIIVFLAVFGFLIAVLITPIINFLLAIWGLVVATPVYDAIVYSGSSQQGYFEIPGESEAPDPKAEQGEEEPDEDVDAPVGRGIPYTPALIQSASRLFQRAFPRPKQKRE
jgi:hypothetical protein